MRRISRSGSVAKDVAATEHCPGQFGAGSGSSAQVFWHFVQILAFSLQFS